MIIDVAAGVLINANQEVLIAQRPEGKHMAGYWEFPGGKFEAGETASEALHRELKEELGVEVCDSEPLIELVHHYPERSVRLHVRVVREWSGEPQSLDQQALAWAAKADLANWRLLPADGPIVNAIVLPSLIAVSPAVPVDMDWEQLSAKLTALLKQNVNQLHWRQEAFTANSAPSAAAQQQAERVARWALDNGVTACLHETNIDLGNAWASRLGFSGLHLTEQEIVRLDALQVDRDAILGDQLEWLSASCHGGEAVYRAEALGVDYGLLGTVQNSESHPGAELLGWNEFALLAEPAKMPIYAIGGCAVNDVVRAKLHSGQGIAAIGAFFRS